MTKDEEITPREAVFQDNADIVRFATKKHEKKLVDISEDFILFPNKGKSEITANFLREQYKIAEELRIYIEDKYYAEAAFNVVMKELKFAVLLERNTKENFIVRKLIEPTFAPENKENDDRNIIQKLTGKMKKGQEDEN